MRQITLTTWKITAESRKEEATGSDGGRCLCGRACQRVCLRISWNDELHHPKIALLGVWSASDTKGFWDWTQRARSRPQWHFAVIKYHHGGSCNGAGDSTGDCWWQNCQITNMSQKYTMGERVISQSDGWPQTTCRGSGEGTKWIMRYVLPLDLWQSDGQQCRNTHSFKHAFWCYLNWHL